MTRLDWIDELRADLRPTDPDPVMLAQLVALSHASVAPAARTGQSVGARLAIALGGAIAVGATSWAAGALPGTDSPFQPEDHVTHQPTAPTPGDVNGPQPGDSGSPAGGQSPPPAGGVGSPPPSREDTASPPTPTPTASDSPPSGHDPQPPAPPPLPKLPELPDRPDVPERPDLPTVPTVPEPPGLDHVPDDLPVDVEDLVGSDRMPAPETDHGARRTPRPQEAQVSREQ